MKDIRILLCIVIFVGACAGPPKIRPVTSPNTQAVEADCAKVFPSGHWRFVHSISVKLPDGRQGLFVGVTVISADAGTIDCVIMSVEGFVFFDARMDGELTIHRAVRPFESEAFARGIMRDIKLIFFKPRGRAVETGLSENGFFACRYRLSDGGVEDVTTFPDNSWEIRQYDKNRRLTRTVNALQAKNLSSEIPSLVADTLKLKAHDRHPYELTMKLVEAERLSK